MDQDNKEIGKISKMIKITINDRSNAHQASASTATVIAWRATIRRIAAWGAARDITRRWNWNVTRTVTRCIARTATRIAT